jgi:hypothetical protein
LNGEECRITHKSIDYIVNLVPPRSNIFLGKNIIDKSEFFGDECVDGILTIHYNTRKIEFGDSFTLNFKPPLPSKRFIHNPYSLAKSSLPHKGGQYNTYYQKYLKYSFKCDNIQ